MRLKNKVTVVSSGSMGIGRAICMLYALQGTRVAVNFSEEADRDYPDQKGIKLFNDKVISNYK